MKTLKTLKDEYDAARAALTAAKDAEKAAYKAFLNEITKPENEGELRNALKGVLDRGEMRLLAD